MPSCGDTGACPPLVQAYTPWREPATPGWPSRGLIIANVATAMALAGLVIGTAEQPRFAAGFVAGAAITLGIFRLGALALMRGAAAVRSARRPAWRLGLANLHRPGAPTPVMVVALGVGLTTLAAIATGASVR